VVVLGSVVVLTAGAAPPLPPVLPPATVTISGQPGNGLITFPTLTLTTAQLAALPQTTVKIDGGTTTETGPTVSSVLAAAGFTPIAACKNDVLRYWVEASSLNGSAAEITTGELDPSFGDNPAILSIEENGTAQAAPRLVVPGDATDARDVPDVYNITVGRAAAELASTTAACNPPSFTPPVTAPATEGPVLVNGDVASPTTWSFAQLGDSALFPQVTQTDLVNKKTKIETGPALFSVLSANAPEFGPAPNDPARFYVEATSSEDGSAVLVSWAEIDPALSGSAVTSACSCKLLSLVENGVGVLAPPLGTGQDTGPRLTVPGDVEAGRYDFGVQVVTVFRAPDIALPAAGSGPDLQGTNLNKAMLANGYLVGATMQGANANRTDLAGAMLDNASLEGANLNRADLAGALLNGASLDGANLNGADLSGANLTGASLAGANLQGVTWSTTTCPDGSDSDADGGTCANDL
jgi:hypothetical protein